MNKSHDGSLRVLCGTCNTDIEGRLYLSVTHTANRFQVDVFSDSGRSQLVAAGHSDTTRGTVALEAVEESGLVGAVKIEYVSDIDSIEISVIPDLLSWQFDFLREQWREQDWPASTIPGPGSAHRSRSDWPW